MGWQPTPARALAGTPGTWAQTGTVNQYRYENTSTLLPNGDVLVTGGRNASWPTVPVSEVFDPSNNGWTVTGNPAISRRDSTATLLQTGKVLLAGGRQNYLSTCCWTNTAEIYDPASGTWSMTGGMSQPRSDHTATLLPDGRVLVVGGTNYYYLSVPQDEVYDPGSGTWSNTNTIPIPRHLHTATLLQNGKVLVTGGQQNNGTYRAEANLYDPSTATWSAAGSMTQPRANHIAVLLPDGRVLVSGGHNAYYASIAVSEVYDPNSNSWYQVPDMAIPRTNAAAALLKSGKVLVTGGYYNGGLRLESEIFNPQTNSWSGTGNLIFSTHDSPLTVLPDGTAVIEGLYGGMIYTPPPYSLPPRGVYNPLPPFRILDTRQCAPCGAPIGPYGTPFGTGTVRSLQVGGNGSLPWTAYAVVLNVTATNASNGGFFTLYPHGAPRPNASNVNFVAGQTVPNLVQVAVGDWGQVDLYNYFGNADMIIDVAGYFTAGGSGGLFNPQPPTRVLDTRQCAPCGAPIGPFSTPFASGETRVLPVGVPAGTSGAVLNVTVTNPTTDGFLTVFPDGASRPNSSNVNFSAGQTVPNRVYVKLGSNGAVDIFNYYGSADVIVDVNGYFSDGSAITSGYQYYPLAPVRIIDTRQCAPCGAPIGPYGSPLGAGQVDVVTPAISGAQALVANVTATDTSQGGFFTLYPDGSARPNASDLNWVAGETVPNLTVTKLSSSGNLDVYNYYGSADLIIDVNGYYGP